MGFLSGITRVVQGVATGGLSEFARKDPFGVPSSVGQYTPLAVGAGLGALVGNPMAGAGLGAGIFGAKQAADAQSDANRANWNIAQSQMMFSADQAQKQMDFQREMSGNAYQRQAADMMKAGINPIVGFGSGASTPSGAMGSSASATMNAIPSTGMAISASAMDFVRLLQELSESNSRIDKNRASAGLDVTSQQKMSADAWIQMLKKRMLERLLNSGKRIAQEPGVRVNALDKVLFDLK